MTEPNVLDVTKPESLVYTKEINKMWYVDLEIEATDYIKPEGYLDIDEILFIVKELKKIRNRGELVFKARAEHNLTELNFFNIAAFNFVGQTCSYMVNQILAGTTWTSGTISVAGTATVKSDKQITVLAALMLVIRAFRVEINFNSKARTIDVKTQIGDATKKIPIRYDKNAEYIEKIENTEKLCTRLYCYGKDGLTIASLNSNLPYLDSAYINDYRDIKEVTIYTSIDVVATLLLYAQIYLAAYEIPILSYIVNILDKSIFPLWHFETLDLGDTSRVYDADLDANIDCRIKKIEKDLAKNTIRITFSNRIDDIIDLLESLNMAVLENTYEDQPSVIITPEPIETYDDPIPIQGIYTIATGIPSCAGTLTSERALARDSYGNFHAVWQAGVVNNENVFYGKSVDDGRTWSIQQITIPDSVYFDFQVPSIAINSSNDIFIVCCNTYGSAVNQNLLYVSEDNGTTFGAVIEIPFGMYWNSEPSIGIDKNDVVHVVQLRYYAGGRIEHISSADKGANWGTKHTVLESTIGNVKILDTGCPGFEVSWDTNNVMHIGIGAAVYVPLNNYHIYYLNSSNGGTTWIHQVVLNKSVNNVAGNAKFAVGYHNYSLYFVWSEIESGIQNIYFNTCTNNVWGTPELVSGGINDCYDPTVSLDSNDKVYVSWTESVALVLQLKIRTRRDGVWGIEFTRTTSDIQKRRPHLVHAQNPTINGLKPCIIYDGFAMMYEEYNGATSDMKFWIDCSQIF